MEDAVVANAQKADLNGCGMIFDIPKKDIPVPIWMLESRMSAQAEKTAAYWLQAIEGGPPVEDPVLGTVYQPVSYTHLDVYKRQVRRRARRLRQWK